MTTTTVTKAQAKTNLFISVLLLMQMFGIVGRKFIAKWRVSSEECPDRYFGIGLDSLIIYEFSILNSLKRRLLRIENPLMIDD
jgi:hypothetical protein